MVLDQNKEIKFLLRKVKLRKSFYKVIMISRDFKLARRFWHCLGSLMLGMYSLLWPLGKEIRLGMYTRRILCRLLNLPRSCLALFMIRLSILNCNKLILLNNHKRNKLSKPNNSKCKSFRAMLKQQNNLWLFKIIVIFIYN